MNQLENTSKPQKISENVNCAHLTKVNRITQRSKGQTIYYQTFMKTALKNSRIFLLKIYKNQQCIFKNDISALIPPPDVEKQLQVAGAQPGVAAFLLIPAMDDNTFALSKKQEKTIRMDTKIIGSKIAKARKEKNMSQAQLAQLLSISPQAVGKWERGESVPDILTFNRLAEILGVDLNYFSENFQSAVEENDIGNNEPVTEEAGNTTQGNDLLTNFSGRDLAKADFAGVITQPHMRIVVNELSAGVYTIRVAGDGQVISELFTR